MVVRSGFHRRRSTALVHYDFSDVAGRRDYDTLDDVRREVIQSPRDRRIEQALGWNLWHQGSHGYQFRYWALSPQAGGEPQMSNVVDRTSLEAIFQRQAQLNVQLSSQSGSSDTTWTIRPRCYAADAYLADQVLRGDVSSSAYRQSMVRLSSPSDLPTYEHEILSQDPIGGPGYEDTQRHRYNFVEIIEWVPSSPPWIRDSFDVWARRR